MSRRGRRGLICRRNFKVCHRQEGGRRRPGAQRSSPNRPGCVLRAPDSPPTCTTATSIKSGGRAPGGWSSCPTVRCGQHAALQRVLTGYQPPGGGCPWGYCPGRQRASGQSNTLWLGWRTMSAGGAPFCPSRCLIVSYRKTWGRVNPGSQMS